jgi:folate-binding protein YgfZ
VETIAAGLSFAPLARDYVGVRGPDAERYLQKMVSNDVAALGPGESCEALLLTAKARVIAPMVVVRRDAEDYLLVTEAGLGERLRAELLRSRFAAKAMIEPEEHSSLLLVGAEPGALAVRNRDYGLDAWEAIDADPPDGAAELGADALEELRIRARTARVGREVDERVLPAEAGLVERAVSFTKGCYPGQEPVARLHYRGHANRALRALEIDTDEPPPYDAEIRHGDKAVGRVTSAVVADGRVVALGYVRVEVPDDAELTVGPARARSLH